MSTTVTFAGNLVEDPELLHPHDEQPFVSCRVLVSDRVRNAEGDWVDAEPTAHEVKVYGTAAINFYDSAGRGDRVIVHGLLRTEVWIDRDSEQRHMRQVVEVSNHFGEVGGSFKFVAARIERQRPSVTKTTQADSTDQAAGSAAG